MQPGETITPGTSQPAPEAPAAEQQPAPALPEQPSIPPQPSTSWQETSAASTTQPAEKPAIDTVNWTASEFIAHHKSGGWFVAAAVALVLAVALVYVLTRDIVAAVMLAIAGILFGVFSARPPRVLEYAVTDKGIQIGQRFFPYDELKSFAVSDEGPLPSILLIPLKRFLPPITVFYERQAEDSIINVLSSYLPFEHKPPDVVDKLMARIRF